MKKKIIPRKMECKQGVISYGIYDLRVMEWYYIHGIQTVTYLVRYRRGRKLIQTYLMK